MEKRRFARSGGCSCPAVYNFFVPIPAELGPVILADLEVKPHIGDIEYGVVWEMLNGPLLGLKQSHRTKQVRLGKI